MMLPDRHILIDAARLQADFDAEGDRAAFARLRALARAARAPGDPPLPVSMAIIAAFCLLLTLIAAMGPNVTSPETQEPQEAQHG